MVDPTRIPQQLTRLFGLRRSTPLGAAPGTLVFDPDAHASEVKIIAYDPKEISERTITSPDEITSLERTGKVLWINVDGLGDEEMIRAIAAKFQLHPLATEDVLNVSQRPKVEEYPNQTFMVVRMASFEKERLQTEQVTMFLGSDYVITFQERPGDCLEPVRVRLRAGRGRARTSGADYLAYALLDTVVDHCFPVLEAYGDRIASLEDEVLDDPKPSATAEIHEARRDLIGLRRAVWPMREMLATLHREPSPQIKEETRIYLRDCFDHAMQILDLVESYRDVVSGLLDVYLSSVSNRMNEIMKVLTLIATIFIPLSFIAGVYGMNFDASRSPLNMPELSWYFGYPFALFLMALTAGGFVVYFVRKGWLGRS